jgi:hypothetical protein
MATTAPRGAGFKMLRILILMLVLLSVAVSTCVDRYRTTRWRDPLFVAIYPIAADGSPDTRAYMAGLDAEHFQPIDRFFAREAARYRLGTARPVETRLRRNSRKRRRSAPPTAECSARSGGACGCATGPGGSVAMSAIPRTSGFSCFITIRSSHRPCRIPWACSKGQIGVVYAFAADWMTGANDVVIAHELLHTLGATDKYNAGDSIAALSPMVTATRGKPTVSAANCGTDGRAAHDRCPTSGSRPTDLDEVVIGAATALEIRWPRARRDCTRVARVLASPQRLEDRRVQKPLVASTEVDCSVIGAPVKSVNLPPASVTIAASAAISRIFTSDSMTTSILPAASR